MKTFSKKVFALTKDSISSPHRLIRGGLKALSGPCRTTQNPQPKAPKNPCNSHNFQTNQAHLLTFSARFIP